MKRLLDWLLGGRLSADDLARLEVMERVEQDIIG